jgi:hypothetical protein
LVELDITIVTVHWFLWNRHEPVVNLEVAVMADENALRELAPKRFSTSTVAAGEIEALCVAVTMMKAERPQTPLVAADPATPTHGRDHLSLKVDAFDTAVCTA